MGTPILLGNAVLATSITTGTGTYAIGDAVEGYFAFADAGIASGSRVSYTVVDSLTAPTKREVGEGVLTSGSPWTLTRATIRASLSGGVAGSSAINWSSGTRYIFITPLAQNTPQYDTDGSLRAVNVAKVWGSWNGSTLNDGFGVASVTDHGAGDFTVTFTEPFASANYAALGTATAIASDGEIITVQPRGDTSQRAAWACRFNTAYSQAGTRTLLDSSWSDFAIFGVHA